MPWTWLVSWMTPKKINWLMISIYNSGYMEKVVISTC